MKDTDVSPNTLPTSPASPAYTVGSAQRKKGEFYAELQDLSLC